MEEIKEDIKYEEEGYSRWDSIAVQSEKAWFTHLSGWAEIEAKWPGVTSWSYSVKGKGILPLFRVKKNGFKYLASGYKGWGGPALINPSEKTEAEYYGGIDSIAKEINADWVEIRLPSLMYSENPLRKYGYQEIKGQASIIQLNQDENVLFNKIDKKCRYEIRKQEKLGLKVKFTEATDIGDIMEYYEIHCKNYERTNTPANPLWYFEDLWKRFYPTGIVRFFFIEDDCGKKVAAASVAMWKGKAIYLTGASLEEAREKGLNHYLQWRIIQYLRNQGYSYYEMGEIDDSTEKAKNLGRFKVSFGGSLYPIYSGIKVYRPWRYRLYKFLRKVKAQASWVKFKR